MKWPDTYKIDNELTDTIYVTDLCHVDFFIYDTFVNVYFNNRSKEPNIFPEWLELHHGHTVLMYVKQACTGLNPPYTVIVCYAAATLGVL